jgi:hypothetical protein
VNVARTALEKIESKGPLPDLINDGCHAIGGIYELNYQSAVVLTDDFRKSEAGGVPLGCYLLAVAGNQTQNGYVLDDEEVILLRVRGTRPLPNEQELVQTRLAVVRDATTSGERFDAVADVLTRNELQQSAFDCEVIGTFFINFDDEGSEFVEFGADIDNVVSSAKYQVFLPSTGVLSWLASFPGTEDTDSLEIGKVRYASTTRRARVSGIADAKVRIRVSDFIGRKTAVFGMTRTGKSNTIKALVTAVHRYASEHEELIGQLIFDPQGEYANVNKQDNTGLKLLGDENTVRIYRFGAKGGDPQVRPLGMNFYDLDNFNAVADLVCTAVLEQYGSYAYVQNFASINWEQPHDSQISEWASWTRSRVGLYGLLSACGFQGDTFCEGQEESQEQSQQEELWRELKRDSEISFTWSEDGFKEFSKVHPGLVFKTAGLNQYAVKTPSAAKMVTMWMVDKGTWNTSSKNKNERRPFSFIAEVIRRESVQAVIRNLTGFHSVVSTQRVEDQVWDDMSCGRLAIVDLSYGNGNVPKIISEKIVNHLLNRAGALFREGMDPIHLQIVVEEAHNLFERSKKEVANNPWVRLSKEAAKYKMGLVYATQEVSSVDQRILSNTSNWLVAHLNSDNETRELSHYYDYKTWADSLRRCEDVGFVRMKSYSGKYIVPVQIAKFDHAMINEARTAAGLKEVTLDENGQVIV